MNKILLCIVLLFPFCIKAQKHYFGAEIGVKLDKFEYWNSADFQKDLYIENGSWGFYFGTRKQHYTIEYGFHAFYSALPHFYYIKESRTMGETAPANVPFSKYIIGSDNGTYAFVIPIRFSKEHYNKKNKLFISSAVGGNLFIFRSASGDGGRWTVTTYGAYESLTEAKEYRKNIFYTGIEGNITVGLKLTKQLELYYRTTFYSQFNTVFYDAIIHTYNDGEVIYGSNSYNGTSYTFLIGMRYNYHNLDQVKKLIN